MYNSFLLGAVFAFLTNAPLSTGQTTTFTARSSTIPIAPLTTSFLPTSTPPPTSRQSPDPWQCATKNITQYFDVPKPTAALLSALESYGDVLLKPCLATATGLDILSCSVSETSKWCGFATDARPAIQTRYSAYGSAAASWYGAKSSAIESIKKDCPVTWDKVGPIDQAWLNQTVVHAKCYDVAHPKPSTTAVSTSSTSKKS
ncbi:hypothetical protein GQ44DRAFT_729825 [Phaeosphaeriaceae sp. PMI808]|nr:hypothetical protein GQ44DRAFT_729825 [Phaeosphaeriaceae sp. PMI808]